MYSNTIPQKQSVFLNELRERKDFDKPPQTRSGEDQLEKPFSHVIQNMKTYLLLWFRKGSRLPRWVDGTASGNKEVEVYI